METLGFLAGEDVGGIPSVTVLFIPQQTGTSASCQATAEGEASMSMFFAQEGLRLLGWIHVRIQRLPVGRFAPLL